MDYADAVLGHYQVAKLRSKNESYVLVCGADRFTRAQLARVECFNFVACQRLTALFTALRVPNLKHVFERITPAELAAPQIGVVSLAVLGAAFEAKGLGGDAPLLNYVKRHMQDHVVTFDTFKRHARDQPATVTIRKRKQR